MPATINGRLVQRQEVLDQVAVLRDFHIDQIPYDEPRLDIGLDGASIGEVIR